MKPADPSIQAAVISLVTAVVGLVVGLGAMSSTSGGYIVAAAAIIIPSVFLIANAVIHHGVATAQGTVEAAKITQAIPGLFVPSVQTPSEHRDPTPPGSGVSARPSEVPPAPAGEPEPRG